MATAWKKVDTGKFALDLPTDWVTDEPRAGTLLAQDARAEVTVTAAVVGKKIMPGDEVSAGGQRTSSTGVSQELGRWVQAQNHVKVHNMPRILGTAAQPMATVEGVEAVGASRPWWKRLLRRLPPKLWRFWAIVHSGQVLLISCSGSAESVERFRATVDRMVSSARIRETNLLLGRQFMETVVSLARSYFPKMAVAMIDDGHLQFGSRNVSVVRLHRRYLASPENLPTHVKAFFKEVQGDPAGGEAEHSWRRARGHIMPVLVTAAALEQLPAGALREEWINGLSVTYVLEDGRTDRTITRDDARRWKVSEETLHEQALRNLVGHSQEQTMEGQRAEGYTMLVLATPEKHNAARILLPELHRKLREHLGPTFYAALPTREFLLAFSTGKEEVLAQVRQQVAADFSRAREGLSNKLFLVTPDGIAGDPGEREEWEW